MDKFLLAGLAIISGLTSLTVQALKKVLDEKGVQYSSNLLAVIVSVILAVAICVGYVLYTSTAFSIQIVIIIIAMTYLAFLCATCGYDKTIQMLEQLKR